MGPGRRAAPQREGGAEELRTTRGQEAHAEWLTADTELQTRRPELSARERARAVARRFGEKAETVRKRVRKMRSEVGKPSQLPQKSR